MSISFDENQLPKCYDRLNKAKEALQQCRNARTFGTFTSAWANFLTFTGSVIHAVEAGAQKSPQGRQWYGRVRRDSRSDELLQYMYQARNAEEHGTRPPVANAPWTGMGMVNPDTNLVEPFAGVDWTTGKDVTTEDDFRTTAYEIDPDDWERKKHWKFGIGYSPSGPVLTGIKDDRHGNFFPPPSRYGGKPLRSNDPIALAELYLNYLSELINEAANLR